MSELRTKLQAIVAEVAELDDPAQVVDESRLYEDLDVDSMMALEIVLMIEETFQVSIDEETLRDIRTFGDMLQQLKSHRENGD